MTNESHHHYSDVIMTAMTSQIKFRRRSKKTSKFRVTGQWIYQWPVNSPHKGALTRNVSIWWRHHATGDGRSYGRILNQILWFWDSVYWHDYAEWLKPLSGKTVAYQNRYTILSVLVTYGEIQLINIILIFPVMGQSIWVIICLMV